MGKKQKTEISRTYKNCLKAFNYSKKNVINIAIKNNCTPIEVIQNYCRKNLESKSDTIRLTNLIIDSLN